MTSKTAKSVKHLALPCYKAIQMIVGERECPECISNDGFVEHPKGCPTCNGTRKVGWKWKPKPYEWVLFRGQAKILMDTPKSAKREEYVPILDWEKIGSILAQSGYELITSGTIYYSDYTANIMGGDKYIGKIFNGSSWQEAVMKAVIELAKEV